MFNYLKKLFLTIFGKIKVFKWPMFIVYDRRNKCIQK